jgi:nicotinic acid mononucleotide adenylyltransferase
LEVAAKLNMKHVAGNHRIKMCELAVKDSDWIMVDKSFSTGSGMIAKIQSQLSNHYQSQLIRVMYVCGADVITVRQLFCINLIGL